MNLFRFSAVKGSWLLAALLVCLLGVSGCCKKKADEDTGAVAVERTPEQIAGEAIYGDWSVTAPEFHDTADMDSEEAEFVRAVAAQVKTWVTFREDGTATMRAQVGDAPEKKQELTWKVTSVERTHFNVEMIGEGQEAPQDLRFEPQADGSVTMTSGDDVLLLVREEAAAPAAVPAPTPSEAPADAPVEAPTDAP